MTPRIRAACLTDIGRTRSENQDRCLFDEALGLFGVADGVGGLPGGGEAAETAAATVTALLRALPADAEPDLTVLVGKRRTPG